MRVTGNVDLEAWYGRLRGAGLPLAVVASSAHGQVLYDEADYRRPVVLLLGSEREGLAEAVKQRVDVVVRLPQTGRATSLNVSAAAAVLIYEVVRQRVAGSG